MSGTFYQVTQPVSAASLPLPTGAATAVGQAAIVSALGSPLQAGGAVSVSNFPASQAVTGTFWQATQPVSFTWAGLTDAQLRASPLALPTGAATEATLASMDAKLPAMDAGRLPVSLPPGGGGLTDAELRAEPVEVIDTAAASMFLRFFNLFTSPPGYDPALQRQRITAIVESGTVTTVTTVSTVTSCTTVGTVNTVANQTLMDGVQGRLLAYGADLSAWHDCVRTRIT